ncbi:MAG: ATP-binding protein [Spirochaetia bacterium]|nr:ATP-binding protein [Spirochaetia bacterium]MBR5016864.1 ATP-binding protein [Spirochaetia bacterium]
MLRRKILEKIDDFYKENTNRALLITGARQVGKSYIVEQYAKERFKSFIKIDFIENSDYKKLLEGAVSADEILLRISSVFGKEMIPGKTLIFFDEVQECKEIVTQIKYLVQDGTYKYILSGSLLGVIFQELLSVPVGYMGIMQMFPLDLEEFAWANGVDDKVIEALKQSFDDKTPVDSFIHERMLDLIRLYLIVGGMPAAVEAFLNSHNLYSVLEVQKDIIKLLKKDISKYDKEEKLYINEIFELIPSELNEKNKRFIFKNLNETQKSKKYNNSFLWLKNAGVALPVYVAEEPHIPLVLSKATNKFKLFLGDVGLLASLYAGDIQKKILEHQININFGAIYENLAAQELAAHGFKLYYYNSKKFGELDFMIECDDQVVPIEVKSGKDYYRHKAMNNVLNNKEYALKDGYVFCNGNTEKKGNVTYFPIYMVMFLKKKELDKDSIYKVDFSDLNSFVSENKQKYGRINYGKN